MDLVRVTEFVRATTRADLESLSDQVVPLGGGTWLYSEVQPQTTGLVDLTSFGWPPFVEHDGELEIAATCTLAQLHGAKLTEKWPATQLFSQGCEALLASFKIWNIATVGGNICLCFPAGAVLSIMSGLDAELLIWKADGSDVRIHINDFVAGPAANVLEPGDIVRSIHIAQPQLHARTAFRKLALRPLGRSGNVVVGRVDPDGSTTITITASTSRPVPLRFPGTPTPEQVDQSLADIDPALWHFDAHGSPAWRAQVATLLVREVAAELSSAPSSPSGGLP